MATEIASAFVDILPSAKGFGSKVTKEVGSEVDKSSKTIGSRAGKQFGDGFTRDANGRLRNARGQFVKEAGVSGGLFGGRFSKSAGKRLDGEGRRLGGSFGKVFAAAAGIGIGVKLVGYLKSSIGAASDLGETISKVNQIFGGAQGKVLEKWSKNAATAMGQSRQQALDAASTFAVFGKSAGLTGAELTTFSTKFSGLAGDLASFHNTSPEEAIEAIGAALRGEAEPMRRYGVLLDDASLRQEALRLGLIKTTKEALTPQQKVLASQALIYKQTKDAQGDFARTSGGLANQQRILGARFADLKTKIGSVFLPIATRLVTFLNKNLAPALARIQKAFKPVGDYLAKTFGPVIERVTGFMKDNPAVVKAFAIALGVLAVAIGVVTLATAAFSLALNSTGIPLIIIGIAALVAGLVYAYQHSEKFRAVVDQVGAALARFGAFIRDKVLPVVLETATKVKDNLQPVFEALVEFFTGSVAPVVTNLIKKFREWQPTIQRVVLVVAKVYGKFLEFYTAIAGKVLPIVIRFAGWLLRTLVPVIVRNIEITAKIIAKIYEFGQALVAGGRKVGDFAGKVKARISDVLGYFRKLPGQIKSKLGDLRDLLVGAGRDVLQGFWNGLKEKWKSVEDWFGGITSKIPKVKGPPAKDRRMLRPAGRLVMQGFEEGLVDGERGVMARLSAITANVAATRVRSSSLTTMAAATMSSAVPGDGAAALTNEGLAQAVARALHEMGLTLQIGNDVAGRVVLAGQNVITHRG